MNEPLDDVLQRYFSDVATADDRLGDTPTRVIMRRGARRKARRRTGVMAGTLAVGTLASVVAINTLSRGDGAKVGTIANDDSNGTDDGPVSTDATPTLAPSPLVWNPVTVGSAEALAQGGLYGMAADPNGGFYAISSQPGRSQLPTSTLYHSDDGIHWTPQGTPPSAISARSDLAAAGGTLYAVGTAAATAPTGEAFEPGTVAMTQSSDGGVSWDSRPVPIDLQPMRQLPGVKAVQLSASVGAGSDGVVIAAIARATLDTSSLTPAGVDPEALDWWTDPNGAIEYEITKGDCTDLDQQLNSEAPAATDGAATATTVSLSKNADGSCSLRGAEVRRYSYEDLGVTAETLAAMRGEVTLLHTSDGTTFTTSALPPVPDGWNADQVRVITGGDRVLVAVTAGRRADDLGTYESQTTLYSSDGTTWTPMEVPLASVSASGLLADGSLVIVGSTAAGARAGDGAIAVLRDDGTWQTTGLAGLVDDPAHYLYLDASASIGATGIAAVVHLADAESGAPTASTTGDPTAATTPDVMYGADGTPVDLSTERSVLMFSRDGVTWSSQPLTDITGGAAGYVSGVQVTGSQVLLATQTTVTSDDPNAPLPDQTIYVGTLAG